MSKIMKVRFCPGCGKELPEVGPDGEVVKEVTIKLHGNWENEIFDIYCPSCQWSGEIDPDR